MKNLSPAKMLAVIARLQRENERLRAKKTANVNGGSKDVDRGGWCTPRSWAERVGSFALDPFSNLRSHIKSDFRCMLEDGGNGLRDLSVVGSFRGSDGDLRVACESWKVFLQPPYEMVLAAIAHYRHTQFCALLRFDPSTEWFRRLYRISALVCVPRQRIDFEPPPGVKASKNPFPHALYYARAEDATPAVLRSCIAWRP